MELQKSKLLIGFSTGESQGIAWAEAWACDVPTLIIKNDFHIQKGKKYKTSTSPYLCDENGLFFDDLNDFSKKFKFAISNLEKFQPREWIINNMSDEYSSLLLYNFIKNSSK